MLRNNRCAKPLCPIPLQFNPRKLARTSIHKKLREWKEKKTQNHVIMASEDRTQETYFKKTINWMYGDDAKLHKQVPEDLGKMHINDLLGRHPFYPYDPEISKNSSHPCYKTNEIFFTCLSSDEFKEMPLHMKHVSCYHPYKVDHMKCLVRARKEHPELFVPLESKGTK